MKEQILDLIERYGTIIIHRHIRPDPDAIGSQGALAELIKAAYPHKDVYCVGEENESLTFLTKMDEIDDEVYEGALVIVCDTANEPRISDDRYKMGERLIKIDHHPNEDRYGDVMWVDPSASSVSEMIYELYLFGKERGFTLTDKAARLIYAGMVGDTGRFLFANTTDKTFRYASELVANGLAFTEVYEPLNQRKLELVRLNGYVLQQFTFEENGIGYIKLPLSIQQQFGVTPGEASLLINSFADVEGIKAWAFFIEEEDQIRVRLRSKGPIVNRVAAKYDGGGHPLAAGATIYNWDDADKVLNSLKEACAVYVKDEG